MKIIFHIDLDSYFVSVARIVNHDLRNKPVVICRGTSKSIVTAASYEAKQRGVKVGLPLFLAKQKAPQVIAVKPNYNLYAHFSNKVFESIASNYTNKIEVASIDECYIDATSISKRYNGPVRAAKHLQAHILKNLKLPLSIGISTNKFVAKMSTQINKPLGVALTWPHDFLKVFGKCGIAKYHGIGRQIAPKLAQMGIKTIADLASSNASELKPLLGKNTAAYIARANGIGSDDIDPLHHNLKSVGNSITFTEYQLDDKTETLEVLANLCQLVATRCQKHHVVGKVVAVALRTKNLKRQQVRSKQKTLLIPIQNYELIYKEAKQLFYKLWKQTAIRFISVSMHKLENVFDTTYQMSWADANDESEHQAIVRNINKKFNSKVVYLGNEQTLKGRKKDSYLEDDKFLERI